MDLPGDRHAPRKGSRFTNHAGIVDFKGSSYFFYQNEALPGGVGFTRSAAVERFGYNADGTTPTINMTPGGAPQAGTLNPFVRQEVETIAWGSGIETEPSSEGGMNVGWIENGDYVKVNAAAFGGGARTFGVRSPPAPPAAPSRSGWTARAVRWWGAAGFRHRRLEELDDCHCPNSGATGTRDLYLRFAGGSGYLFNVDWWQFTA